MAIASLAATVVYDSASAQYEISAAFAGQILSLTAPDIGSAVTGLAGLAASLFPAYQFQILVSSPPYEPAETYGEPGGI
jgi:hypothetical protein